MTGTKEDIGWALASLGGPILGHGEEISVTMLPGIADLMESPQFG